MGKEEKRGSIVLDNFNSTANLTANPGFKSTLSLGSKDVISEKAYNPFEHRNVEHPNSSIGSLVHLLKSSLGSGILAMPSAFKNAGLVVGALGTVIVGFICTHCVYVLVKTSQEVCVEAKKPSMGFAETCGAAFEFGPKKLRPWSNFARLFVDYAMTCTYLAALCVYVVFIAENFKEVLDEHIPDYKLSLETYCALTLVPLVLICQIRNLKYLVPFSAIANVLLVICFVITMYYIFTDLPKPSQRNMAASVTMWPIFIRAQAALNPFWTEEDTEASQISGQGDVTATAGSSKNKRSSSTAAKKRAYKKKEKTPVVPVNLPSSGSESDEAPRVTKRKTKTIPDSEDEIAGVYKEPVRAAPLRSFLNQRASSGFTSQSDPARRGEYYFELRIYNTREIERLANSERWKHSIVTLKLTTDLDTSMWKALTRVVEAGKQEFKEVQPILYPNIPF